MKTDLFTILKAAAPVTALLGNNPLRVFPFGRAPQGVQLPYAVYAGDGAPENYLGNVPDIDRADVQIVIFSDSANKSQECFEAIRDALEPHAHMTASSDDDREAATDRYPIRMNFTFWQPR